MMRGIRGATTVEKNDSGIILEETARLFKEILSRNDIGPETISHVLVSATKDLDTAFPAKALRSLPGCTHVPVMCMQEIDVPGALEKCIRIMMVAETNAKQQDVQHVFLNDAIKLRPDLVQGE